MIDNDRIERFLDEGHIALRILGNGSVKRTESPLMCSEVFLIRFFKNKEFSFRWVGYFNQGKLEKVFASPTIIELANQLKEIEKQLKEVK